MEGRPTGYSSQMFRDSETEAYRSRSASRGRGRRGRGSNGGRGASREDTRRFYGKGHMDDDMEVDHQAEPEPKKKDRKHKSKGGNSKASKQNIQDRLDAGLGKVARDGDDSSEPSTTSNDGTHEERRKNQ
jgi:hypothetical protein